jgi:hypothetical protein
MTFQFRPAVRSEVGLIIGLAGGTGSGKTYSAFRIAKGIAGDRPFAVVDSEAGRAKHYADQFRFDHGDLKAPFRPDAYVEAIEAADSAGYPVIIVDSMSHEWAGDGGVLDWQEEEFERLGNRDAVKLLSWSKPKQSHKRMVTRLLQCRAHLILCFRAEPHVEMTKDDKGKTVIKPKQGFTGYNGWFPVTEKMLPFELTVSFMLMAEQPGIGRPIKLQAQHKGMFPAGAALDEDSGRRIAEWARGGATINGGAPVGTTDGLGDGGSSGVASTITPSQAADLHIMCVDNDIPTARLKRAAGLADGDPFERMPAAKYDGALSFIKGIIAKRAEDQHA